MKDETDGDTVTGDVVLACCGASTYGRLAKQVGTRLQDAGEAKLFCPVEAREQASDMAESASRTGQVLILDGCSRACAKDCADRAGIRSYQHLVLTDLDLESKCAQEITAWDLDTALTAVRDRLAIQVTPVEEGHD